MAAYPIYATPEMAIGHLSAFQLDYLQRKALSISEDDIELADFLLDQVLYNCHSLLLHPPIPPLCTNIDRHQPITVLRFERSKNERETI